MTAYKPLFRGRLSALRFLPPWLQAILLVLICLPLMALLLAAWIGLVLLLNRDPANTVSADAALNLLLVVLVALVGLPVMHRGQYRMFWAAQRKRGASARIAEDTATADTPPPPAIAWSPALRIRHAVMYLVAILLLIGTFAPYRHQAMIGHFLDRFSAGSASRGSLASLVFDYLPLLLFCGLAALLTYRQLQRRDAGQLDPDQALELDAELNWLFSFGAAFLIAAFLCRWAGAMILAFL
ncbi:hypothetical protein ACSBM8_00355 [Sphingomonas sp. ASY06-1R]|uniref:hypothetical protein n=1 Tax=Sphingomonas sp. ASY06-1R TaxID=3445771 RepID=UPI003FA2E3AD